MSPRNTKLGQHQPLLEVADGEASWSVGAEAILIVHYEYTNVQQNKPDTLLNLFWAPYPSPTPESAQLCM